jgi:hypothetical protein
MTILNVEPISLLAIVGSELLKDKIRELAIQHKTKRGFCRAVEREILPTVRRAFDAQVAKDVLVAARAVYGTLGGVRHEGVRAAEVQGVRDSGTGNDQVRGTGLSGAESSDAASRPRIQRRL